MINKIDFLNDHLLLPMLLGALILVGAFVWKEWAQAGKRRLVLKISLILLSVFSLIVIALKPALPTTETTGNYALLTENYREDLLDSLENKYKKLQVVSYNPGEPISEEFNSAEKIFVIGEGLKEYDLWQLDKALAVYLNRIVPEGIIQLKFPKEKKVGDSLTLKGLYKKPHSGNRLVLQGPGGAGLDSLVFGSGEDIEFQLAVELKAPGRYVYFLAEKDSRDEILKSDPVPVKVAEKKNLKILIVNSFPTFETKYLKNYLAEAGHEVVVRSQITRGRFKFEYFNTSPTTVGNLSRSTLEAFDLLIIDAASWRTLPQGQATEVENAVQEDGLGIFIQPDETFFKSSGEMVNLDFERVPASEINFSPWPGISVDRYAFSIKNENGLHKIHSYNNQVISGYQRTGQGRIGTTVLSNTWELVLEGKPEAYRHLWAPIIEQLTKKEDLPAEWEQETIIAYPHEPFNFKLRTALPQPEIRNGRGNVIPLKQDPDISSLWEGTTWPKETGWHRMELDTTAGFDYFIFPDTAWNSLDAVKTTEVNRRYFDRDINAGQGERPLEPLNLFWFYGLFLIAMGGLWLEPKI